MAERDAITEGPVGHYKTLATKVVDVIVSMRLYEDGSVALVVGGETVHTDHGVRLRWVHDGDVKGPDGLVDPERARLQVFSTMRHDAVEHGSPPKVAG